MGLGFIVVGVLLLLDEVDEVVLMRSEDRNIELCVGGQTGYYTERQCVVIDTALQAARTFAECGELEPSVEWELQE